MKLITACLLSLVVSFTQATEIEIYKGSSYSGTRRSSGSSGRSLRSRRRVIEVVMPEQKGSLTESREFKALMETIISGITKSIANKKDPETPQPPVYVVPAYAPIPCSTC